MDKKIKTEVAVGIILIIAILFGGLVWLINKQTKQITNDVTNQSLQKYHSLSSINQQNQNNIDATDWKTYTNDRYKFSLKYPLSIVAIDECGGENPNGPESCSGTDISIRENTDLPSSEKSNIHFDILTNYKEQSLELFVNEATQNSKIIERKKSIIDGKNAIIIKAEGTIQLGSVGKKIGKTVFTFIILGPKKISYFEYANKADIALEDKIISTIKFIGPSDQVIDTSIKWTNFCHLAYNICFDYPADAYVLSNEYATNEKEACDFYVGRSGDGEAFLSFDACNFFSNYDIATKIKDVKDIASKVWGKENSYSNPHVTSNEVSEIKETMVGGKKGYAFSLVRDWGNLNDQNDTFIFVSDNKGNPLLLKYSNSYANKNIRERILNSLKIK